MKYIIKEIYNEYNDIYFDSVHDDIINNFNNDIFLLENRDNGGINDDLIKTLINDIYNYSDYTIEYYYNNHRVNYIIDTLKPFKRLSLKQAINIMLLCKDTSIKKDAFILKSLNIIFNATYEMSLLQGYNQSDWIYCFYNSDIVNYEYIQYIEACIFNTGIEVFITNEKIDDSDIDIDDIENNYDGYYDYMVNYFLFNDKLSYLAGVIGCNKDDIKYYEIKDVKTITSHKIIYNEVK